MVARNLSEIRGLIDSAEYSFRFSHEKPGLLIAASSLLLLAAKNLLGYILYDNNIVYSLDETPLSLVTKVPYDIRQNILKFDSIIPIITEWDTALGVQGYLPYGEISVSSATYKICSVTDFDFRQVFCSVSELYNYIFRRIDVI